MAQDNKRMFEKKIGNDLTARGPSMTCHNKLENGMSLEVGTKVCGTIYGKKINDVSYKLMLPGPLRIHPIFHVSLSLTV